jgi:hypothetical protein
MSYLRRIWPGWLEAAAILAVVGSAAYLVQGPTVNASSHHALVRALASGTPRVDETRYEIGDVGTTDVAWYEGHAYSNKAPGLAFAVLPGYLVLEQAGVTATDDPSRVLWALGLVGLALPLALLLLLVRMIAEEVRPGLGGPTAVTLGFGTILLPFSTLFFAHVLSTCLAFAAFACLWIERRGRPRLALVASTGFLCALATSVEHPVALVAFILLPYGLRNTDRSRRALVFVVGFLVGLIPLALYNWWALGSPVRLPYRYSVLVPGESGRDVLVSEVPFSRIFHFPNPDNVLDQLFAQWGLVTASPVLALVPLGLHAIFRQGFRAEALVVIGVVSVFVFYASSYYAPYGDTWAPRFLIPAIPFLALPLARALGDFPVVGAALACGSIALTGAVTLTNPMAAWDGHVLDRLFSPAFESHARTVLSFAGVEGRWDSFPFVAACLFAIAYTAVAVFRTSEAVRGGDVATAGFALAGWAVIGQLAPRVLVRAPEAALVQALVMLGLVAAVLAAVVAAAVGFSRGSSVARAS